MDNSSNISCMNCTKTYTGSDLQQEDIPINVAIIIYSTIFILAVVGNVLVILTLVQNKRMRTVTNVFLLNLALSDLLLAVFCMPFTLVPILIRNFIFGPFVCVAIRYAQGKFFLLTVCEIRFTKFICPQLSPQISLVRSSTQVLRLNIIYSVSLCSNRRSMQLEVIRTH